MKLTLEANTMWSPNSKCIIGDNTLFDIGIQIPPLVQSILAVEEAARKSNFIVVLGGGGSGDQGYIKIKT